MYRRIQYLIPFSDEYPRKLEIKEKEPGNGEWCLPRAMSAKFSGALRRKKKDGPMTVLLLILFM